MLGEILCRRNGREAYREGIFLEEKLIGEMGRRSIGEMLLGKSFFIEQHRW